MITRLLDLTQATLQEWAMKQGIDADVASMTQAEKTMLRYQYVMNNAKLSMGDFAKTANTWANVVKTLKQQFQALGGTIGTVFINAFKPALIALRNFMQHVLDFAKTVADALGAIFGWTLEITASGSSMADDLGSAADSIGDIGSGAGDAGKGLGSAAKGAKDLAKNLSVLPFDELNQLAKDASSSGGGSGGSGGSGSGGSGGGGGGGMSGSGASASLVRTESVLEKITSSLDTLGKLGHYISDELTKAMLSIPWEDIYEKARGFGSGLADFLNSLITPDLFGALGKTIAGAINVAIEGFGGFVDNLNFDNIGIAIGTGINTFFETIHWERAGLNINKAAKGILKAIGKILDTVHWDEIGTDIGEFLKAMEIGEIVNALVEVIDKAVDAAIELLEAMWQTAPVETTLFLGFKAIKILGLATLLKTAIIKHIAAYLSPSAIAASIKSILFPGNIITMSGGPLTLAGLSVTITNIAMGVTGFMQTVNPAAIGLIGAWICDKISEFIDDNLGDQMSEAIGNVVMSLGGATIGFWLGGPIGALVGGIAGLIVAELANPIFTTQIKDAVTGLFGDLSIAAQDIAAGFGIIASSIKVAVLEGLQGLVDDLPEPVKKVLGLEGASAWLQLKIDAEIEKQTDLRKEQDMHLPETGDVTTAVDNTGGGTMIQAAADIDKVDVKDGFKPTVATNALLDGVDNLLTGKKKPKVGTTANLNAAVAADSIKGKKRPKVGTTANLNASTNSLTGKSKPSIGANAKFTDWYNSIGYKPTLDVKAKIVSASVAGSLAGVLKLSTGGVFKNGTWQPIQSFAPGGFPFGGQIFRARENGNPELVGTLKGSTAVMNNNQIVASVSDGVAKAIAGIRFQMTGFRPPEVDVNSLRGVIEYAVVSALANNANERPIQNYVTVTMPNGEVLARAVNDGNKKIQYRESAVSA